MKKITAHLKPTEKMVQDVAKRLREIYPVGRVALFLNPAEKEEDNEWVSYKIRDSAENFLAVQVDEMQVKSVEAIGGGVFKPYKVGIEMKYRVLSGGEIVEGEK